MIIQNQNSSNVPHGPPEQAMAAQPTEPAPPSKKQAMTIEPFYYDSQPEASFHDNKQQNQQTIMQNQQVKMTAAATLATSYCNLLEWLAMCACRGGVS